MVHILTIIRPTVTTYSLSLSLFILYRTFLTILPEWQYFSSFQKTKRSKLPLSLVSPKPGSTTVSSSVTTSSRLILLWALLIKKKNCLLKFKKFKKINLIKIINCFISIKFTINLCKSFYATLWILSKRGGEYMFRSKEYQRTTEYIEICSCNT